MFIKDFRTITKVTISEREGEESNRLKLKILLEDLIEIFEVFPKTVL